MKTRTLHLFVLQAVLATGLLQALPSMADPAPVATGPVAAIVVPWYVSPGIGSAPAHTR